jgi:hypothetical protein
LFSFIIGLVYGVYCHFQQYFRYIVVVIFIGGRNGYIVVVIFIGGRNEVPRENH